MLYTLEKKTQREGLNERLRLSLDSTQFRIRNASFFSTFQFVQPLNRTFSFTFSTNVISFFLNNVFAFDPWFSDFLATFLLSPLVSRFFSNFFVFNCFQIFQRFFCFQPLVFRFFSNFLTFNC